MYENVLRPCFIIAHWTAPPCCCVDALFFPRRNAKILASAGPLNVPPAAGASSSSTAMDVDPPAAPAGGGGAGALGGGSKPRRAADPALVSQVRRCGCGRFGVLCFCLCEIAFFRHEVGGFAGIGWWWLWHVAVWSNSVRIWETRAKLGRDGRTHAWHVVCDMHAPGAGG